MFINSLSNVGIATQVWNQAARTLTADPATDAGAATLVWAHVTRQVTSLSSGVITLIGIGQTALAASGSLDLRANVGKARALTVVLKTGAAGTGTINFWDATNIYVMVSAAAGGNIAQFFGTGTNTAGLHLKNNDGTNPLNYQYGGWEWIQ